MKTKIVPLRNISSTIMNPLPEIRSGNGLLKGAVRRCGVIPYIYREGELLFLLGRDKRTSEYGDFGGTLKKNENPLYTAFREFREETNAVFPKPLYEDFNMASTGTCLIVEGSMAIMFLPVKEEHVDGIEKKFQETEVKKSYVEMSCIRWFSESEFVSLISDRKSSLWTKVRNFLGMFDIDKVLETLSSRYHFAYPLVHCGSDSSDAA